MTAPRVDPARRGLSVARVAKLISVPERTVRSWLPGMDPATAWRTSEAGPWRIAPEFVPAYRASREACEQLAEE